MSVASVVAVSPAFGYYWSRAGWWRFDAHECTTVLELGDLGDLVTFYPALTIQAGDDSYYLEVGSLLKAES